MRWSGVVFAIVLVLMVVPPALQAGPPPPGPAGNPAAPTAPAAAEAGIPTVQVLASEASGLLLDVHVAGLATTEVVQDGTAYTRLYLPNSGATSALGRPELPAFGRFIAVPRGARVEIEVLESASATLSGVLVYPAQAPQSDCAGAADAPFVIDAAFYQEDTAFPGMLAAADEIKSLRGVPVTAVRFFPLQYNPARRELTVYSHLRVRVRFLGGTGLFADPAKRAESFETIYSQLLLNYEQLGAPPAPAAPASPSGAVFLIITHPNYATPANDLAAFRNSQGIDTEVRTTNDTGSTAAQIKAYIQNAYNTWNPAPEYVLLVGDHEWIPTNAGSVSTDLYYYTVDGGDYYPDIHGGRISVDTVAQAQKAIADIIDYDQNPVTDPAFYENVTVAAYFQDDNLDDYEDRRFVRTSEEIRDYLMGQGFTVERIYMADAEANPTHYNDGTYGNGEPLPPDLLRPGFAWDGDSADITAAVEAGRFILNHRDHGSWGGWAEPAYSVADVLALTNGNLLPVVFSMNCQSGGFDQPTDPCFAEAWQRNPNGGAVGVVAASDTSYSGYNDWMCNGIYDAIWPDYLAQEIPGFARPERHMAAALNYGKFIMEMIWGDPNGLQQTEFELFHWFGDPTMQIHVGLPFPDFSIAADPDTLAVCTPEVVTSTIEIGQILSYSYTVALAATNVPAGTTASLVPLVVTPPGTSELTLDVGGATADGDYALVISGTAQVTNVHTVEVLLQVRSAPPTAPTLLAPPDGAINLPPYGILFAWTAAPGATTYRLQVDDDPAFDSPEVDVPGIAAVQYTLETVLDPATLYYWRVQANNACGDSAFSSTFSFSTKVLCILLVDDDNDTPDTRPYFTAALDTLGYNYDVFDVGGGSGSGPTEAEMAGYPIVIWFSGDKYGGSAGPNGTDETALASYLDSGGHLFLSSQDYLYDFGLTPFGQSYLGIGSFTSDGGHATSKYGVAGDPIGDGLGPYSLSYPSGFSDYGDIVNAGGGASVAFRSAAGGGNNLDVDKDGGAWRTVFFGTDWVPIYNNNAANGRQVLQRIVDWFGGCGSCEPPANVTFDWTPAEPHAGEVVTFTGSASGTAPLQFAWALGDGGTAVGPIVVHTYADADDYTVTLAVTNTCGSDAASQALTVLPPLCEPVQIVTVTTAISGCQVTFGAELTGDLPFTYLWDFGALGTSTETNPLVDFGVSGTYPYTLTVWNCDGAASDSRTGEVTVACEPPCDRIEILTVTTAISGCQVTFGAAFTGTAPYTWLWNFGASGTSTETNPVVDYGVSGTYPYTLTAENGCGEDEWAGQVEVECAPPCEAAAVVTVTTTISDCQVTFGAVFTGTAPYTWLWDFGAWGTSTETNPLVDWGVSGTYPYTLTVENDCGEDEWAGQVEVECAPPKWEVYLPLVFKK